MDNFRSEIYDAIKEKFPEIKSEAEFNKEMEADTMAVNLFGEGDIEIKENSLLPKGLYSIEYKKKLKTLNHRVTDPQIDAELLSNQTKTALLFKMKMMEWLSDDRKTLSEAYLIKGHYFYQDNFEIFYQVFQSLIDKSSNNRSIYNNYNAFQIVKQILGIYNAVCKGEYKDFDKIKLVDCVWHLSNSASLKKEVEIEYRKRESSHLEEFEDFRGKLQPIIYLFKEKNVEFDLVYISLDEMLEILDKSDDEI